MTGYDELLALSKGKLNITWSDAGTDARLEAILHDSVPIVSNMVGLTFDFDADDALDEAGEVFDYSLPSMERNLLLNHVSYEWNHQADSFRSAYWQEIAACRQKHTLLAEAEDEDSE